MKAEAALAKHFKVAFLLCLLLSGVLYLGYTLTLTGSLGFPLDDSWIHQTLARNLLLYGRFSYSTDQAVSGSTAPLWTLMLSPGYALPFDFKVWTLGLGLLFHGLSGWMVYLLSLRVLPTKPGLARIAALAYLTEWHMVWVAFSGMETTLFVFLSLALIYLTIVSRDGVNRATSGALLRGATGGLLFLARPEGGILFVLTLVWESALLALTAVRPLNGALSSGWMTPGKIFRSGIINLALPVLASLVFVVPYFLFNLSVTGQPLPSTYYAKNAAYAENLDVGVATNYLIGVGNFLWSGPSLLLLPGVLFGMPLLLMASNRSRPGNHETAGALDTLAATLPMAWAIVLVVLYMFKLPMLYHHGRYVMPIVPFVIMYGVWGLEAIGKRSTFPMLGRTYIFLAAVLFSVLFVNGASTYAWNVKFIDDEQVTVAKWLKENTPDDAVVATHDIGAIGYFSDRRIFDTAGLINPEVTPYLRDQGRLMELAEQRGAAFFAIIPNWYPIVASSEGLREVFRIKFSNTLVSEADNMIVLQVK